MNKRTFISTVVLLTSTILYAHPNTEDPRIQQLETRIRTLETQLQTLLQTHATQQKAQQEPSRAFQRALADADRYTRTQLNIIEKLYAQAQQDWPNAEPQINTLLTTYPHANRTGCALLRFALQHKGDAKQERLIHIIKHHHDAYFPDGVNVGAFAQLSLALHYQKNGNPRKATEQIDTLKQQHPHAIDHRGQLLLQHYESLQSALP